MTKINKMRSVFNTLLDLGKPGPTSIVAKLSGLTPHEVGRILNTLYSRDLISRCKKPEQAYWNWYITEVQNEVYYNRVRSASRSIESTQSEAVAKILFLKSITQSSTLFASSSVLKSILKDYQKLIKNI